MVDTLKYIVNKAVTTIEADETVASSDFLERKTEREREAERGEGE